VLAVVPGGQKHLYRLRRRRRPSGPYPTTTDADLSKSLLLLLLLLLSLLVSPRRGGDDMSPFVFSKVDRLRQNDFENSTPQKCSARAHKNGIGYLNITNKQKRENKLINDCTSEISVY
jgi:hypothetical protein